MEVNVLKFVNLLLHQCLIHFDIRKREKFTVPLPAIEPWLSKYKNYSMMV
jgi:hypothetical protein